MEEPKEQFEWARVVTAFLLTLVAIPALFIATCIPVGFIGDQFGPMTYPIVFAALGIVIAIVAVMRAANPGTRWGIIVAVAAAILGALFLMLRT